MKTSSRFCRQWLAPLGLAVCTAAGLLSALIGDGVWNVFSWLALTAPLLAASWIFTKRPR